MLAIGLVTKDGATLVGTWTGRRPSLTATGNAGFGSIASVEPLARNVRCTPDGRLAVIRLAFAKFSYDFARVETDNSAKLN